MGLNAGVYSSVHQFKRKRIIHIMINVLEKRFGKILNLRIFLFFALNKRSCTEQICLRVNVTLLQCLELKEIVSQLFFWFGKPMGRVLYIKQFPNIIYIHADFIFYIFIENKIIICKDQMINKTCLHLQKITSLVFWVLEITLKWCFEVAIEYTISVD